MQESIVTRRKQRIQLLNSRSNVHFLCIFQPKTLSPQITPHQQKKKTKQNPKHKIKKIQHTKKKQKKQEKRYRVVQYLFWNLQREKENMATMKIPMTVPSPRVDVDQLFKAFKGTYVSVAYVVITYNSWF